ncbi:MAG TPA: sigma-70 family RNA polymerase sigma factor [Myxococcota bacterium]|nr:sigma-70 family RNA polymerase sigma factor [Myxococcota bacterium]
MAEDGDPPESETGGVGPGPGGTAAGQDPDVQLMLAFRGGDQTAFDALFRRWAGPMLRYLERMVRDAASAEDLLQETFLRVFRARDRYQPEARFSTWLYTIATNLALNELRRPRRRAPHRSTDEGESDELPLVLEGHEPRADDVTHARRTSAELERELAALPERQRAALVLSAVEGLSYAEVAVSLETTEKSVKALVHRARATLAAKFTGRE